MIIIQTLFYIQFIFMKLYMKTIDVLKSFIMLYFTFKINGEGFLGGAVVKNPPANAGDTGSSPGPGRSHMLRSN